MTLILMEYWFTTQLETMNENVYANETKIKKKNLVNCHLKSLNEHTNYVEILFISTSTTLDEIEVEKNSKN